MKNRKQYHPGTISYASKHEPALPSAATRFGARLAQFNQVVTSLRSAAFNSSLLEQTSLTRAERAEHARLAVSLHAHLKELLNFSELGRLLRSSMSSSTSAKAPRLQFRKDSKGGVTL